mgnify:CR=1 FL=1
MADDKTAITELATALGCLGDSTVDWAVLQRPDELLVDDAAWDQLTRGLHDPALAALADAAFENGVAFAAHPDALDGKRPRRIEWTGGRRPPGDQVIPADLRIDRVFLVSCKYSSKVLHNAAPARVFDHLLVESAGHDRRDWYDVVAPAEHRRLAGAAAAAVGCPFPDDPSEAGRDDRRRLRDALREVGRRWPEGLDGPYRELCRAVSQRSAERWRTAAKGRSAQEQLLWRLLRLASAPYFVVGVNRDDRMRLRIETPWDWRQAHELRRFDIEADEVGQPQVRWWATVRDRHEDVERVVEGHVEVRWSHGRFGAPPEAKVYLDTPHSEVPGYAPLT